MAVMDTLLVIGYPTFILAVLGFVVATALGFKNLYDRSHDETRQKLSAEYVPTDTSPVVVPPKVNVTTRIVGSSSSSTS